MQSLIFIYPLFFLLVLLCGRDKRNHTLYNLIILLYFIAGLTASYIIFNIDIYEDTQLSLGAICYHLALLFILLVPIRRYEERSDMPLTDINQITKYFTIGVILCAFIYIIDGIQYVNLDAIRNDVSSLRSDLIEGEKRTNNAIISYIAYIYRTLSVAPLVLMFYYLIKHPEKKLLIVILLICSLGTVIVELRFAAREFLIKYIYLSFCLFYILRNHFPKRIKKKIISIGVVLFFLLSSTFLLISQMRFGDRKDTTTQLSLLNYLGQGYVNFSEAFDTYPDGLFPTKGTTCFPFFAGEGRDHFRTGNQINSSIRMNVFRTIIGSWLLDCGALWTIFITFIYAFLFRIIGRNKINNVFSYIYIALALDFSFSLLFFFHESITGTQLLTYFGLFFLDKLSRFKPDNIINQE